LRAFSTNITTFSCAPNDSHSDVRLEESKALLIVLHLVSFTTDIANPMLAAIQTDLRFAQPKAPITARHICTLWAIAQKRGLR
jgi:hypothetical protein